MKKLTIFKINGYIHSISGEKQESRILGSNKFQILAIFSVLLNGEYLNSLQLQILYSAFLGVNEEGKIILSYANHLASKK